jgi:hypothetical protein
MGLLRSPCIAIAAPKDGTLNIGMSQTELKGELREGPKTADHDDFRRKASATCGI